MRRKKASVPEGREETPARGTALHNAEIGSTSKFVQRAYMRIGARRRLDIFPDPQPRDEMGRPYSWWTAQVRGH
jgi:acetyl-CoA carboxylase carboxyl transferase subunit beta